MNFDSAVGVNYLANLVPAPQILQGTPNYNVEVSEGQNPPGEFYPAPYLPVLLSENRLAGSGFVLMPGKVVTLDGNKRLVPAGFGKLVNKEIATPTSGAGLIKYTSLDTQMGVIGANGTFVADGDDAVVETAANLATAAGGQIADVPVGIMRYSALMAPGSDPSNPATFYKHAYDTGGARAFSRWAYIQIPVVETAARTEVIPTGATTYRVKVYFTGNLTFTGLTPAHKGIGSMLTAPTVPGVADQYSILGRTILFNGAVPDGVSVTYTPTVLTPFQALQVTGPLTSINQLIGKAVSFDNNSNFVVDGSSQDLGYNVVGRILDTKKGQNDDLKLVRSYFRDMGLWQEQPGSATDGRNTQLSIVNAPSYIVRIAVNFNSLGLA